MAEGSALVEAFRGISEIALDGYVRQMARRMFCTEWGQEPTPEQLARVKSYVSRRLAAGEVPFRAMDADDG